MKKLTTYFLSLAFIAGVLGSLPAVASNQDVADEEVKLGEVKINVNHEYQDINKVAAGTKLGLVLVDKDVKDDAKSQSSILIEKIRDKDNELVDLVNSVTGQNTKFEFEVVMQKNKGTGMKPALTLSAHGAKTSDIDPKNPFIKFTDEGALETQNVQRKFYPNYKGTKNNCYLLVDFDFSGVKKVKKDDKGKDEQN